MSWVDSLEVSIAEALDRFPDQVGVASVTLQQQTYLVSRQSLLNMACMGLETLPIAAIALPYELSDILVRPHEENLIRDFAHHLSDYFPNFFVAAVYELQSLFVAKDIKAYIIGGITRDMLLSAERRFDIQDVDIIIEGKALDAARYVDEASKNLTLLQEYTPFGTAKVGYKDQIEIDFASTRKEIYLGPGLLPKVVEIGVPLEEDIIRRDFTINALALSIHHPGQVIDCTGGLKDLEERNIRLLKPESFFEDPSRIVRALKFALRLDFELGEDTKRLLDQFLLHLPTAYKGGGDRIREELRSLLSQPESVLKVKWLKFFVAKGLHRLIDTHLVDALDLPLPVETISQRIQVLQDRLVNFWASDLTWEIYITLMLLGLPQQQAESAMHRIGLTRHEIEVVEKSFQLLNENILYPLTPLDSAVKLYETFHGFPFGAACVGVLLSPQFETSVDVLVQYKKELEPVTLEVTGDDVLKLGVPQGEQVGRLLKELLYAKLQGRVHHRLDEISWLKAQLAPQPEESHH